MKFYYPLKPTRISIDSNLLQRCDKDPNFILQVKKNGWRVQIHKDGEDIKFFTRHNESLERIVKEADWNLLRDLIKNNVDAKSAIIDGEFLHRRGSLKNTLYVWDIFEHNNEQVKHIYKDRKQLLDNIVTSSDNIYVAQDYNSNFIDVWDDLTSPEENEGIVIKDLREMLYINFNKTIESAKQFKILLEDKRNKIGA